MDLDSGNPLDGLEGMEGKAEVKDWLAKLDPKWVASNIIGWGFLAVVLYTGFVYMVLPMQTAHLELVKDVAKNNTDIARTQEQQTPIINRIDRNTSK